MPWSPSNPPKRGGAYQRFVSQQRTSLAPSFGGTVLVPFTHDWGPFKTFVKMTSFADFIAIYGQGVAVNTPGFIAIYNAFKGSTTTEPGAGTVLGYRSGSSSAAKAAKTLQNTTPAVAITLTAKYEGSRGNNFTWAVEANAGSPGTMNDLVLREGVVELERYAHLKTDIAGLATSVNALSGYFTAVSNITGTALAIIAAANATGGNDGTTLVAGDWTSIMTASEAQSFDVFAPFDLTDGPTITSYIAWVIGLNTKERPKRFTALVGGAAAEPMTTAVTRSTSIDNENMVNVGCGTYVDNVLASNLSTSQLVPRIAGIIARRNYDASVSFAPLADLDIVVGPSDNEILLAIDQTTGKGGVLTLTRSNAGVRIERGINALQTDITTKPKAIFSRIKNAYTMQAFERRLIAEFENGNILGKLDVNKETREFMVGKARVILDDFISVGAFQAGATVGVSDNPPPNDNDEFVALDWVAAFGRSMESVRSTIYVS